MFLLEKKHFFFRIQSTHFFLALPGIPSETLLASQTIKPLKHQFIAFIQTIKEAGLISLLQPVTRGQQLYINDHPRGDMK